MNAIIVCKVFLFSVVVGTIAVPCLCCSYVQNKAPELIVVDRSVSDDNLYYCSVNFLKTDPVETIGLVLKDRQGNKAGDMLLGTIDTSATEKMAAFFLNHELIKNSFVLIQFSDERPNAKIVVGEQRAVQKIDGKTTQIAIE
jgi:hypothetical protein